MTTFASFNLNPSIAKAIEACGFENPTLIQAKSIPIVMAGRDLMASSQTGSGKTASFVVPMLHRLMERPGTGRRGPRALVLTPTRELAVQVQEEVRRFGKFTNLTSGIVVGGMGYGPQYQLLSRPLDVLVATPGRLIDHLDQKKVDLSNVEFLVLDEADRMLDMGFVKPVRRIAGYTPDSKQSLLFSATLEGEVRRVAADLLKQPELVELAANKRRHEGIDQKLFHVDNVDHKRRLLDHWLGDREIKQAVIFTGTKRRADRLAKSLALSGHSCAALHGDKTQGQRKRTIDQMRDGSVKLLVATDVAARGLDIDGISHVINYDLPTVPEDYIHRIGRTGRAGATGTAVSLVAPEDREKLRDIEKLTGNRLVGEYLKGDEPKIPLTVVIPKAPKPAPRGRGQQGGGQRQGAPGQGQGGQNQGRNRSPHSHGSRPPGGRPQGGQRSGQGGKRSENRGGGGDSRPARA
ncbi:DEAD/DEAH box helicase [Luteolibacter ambystomatis]|uniref:DEAD/DEAH box helicase n=1 Tax=Luteolibacter ambystomatis TaxID=2824561 RepID=UPI00363C38A9